MIANGIKKALTITGGAFALTGAGIGAAVGGQLEGDAVMPGAAIGAAAGAAVIPAVGLAGKAGIGIGSAAVKNAGNFYSGVGNAALNAGKVGASALGGITSAVGGVAAAGVGLGSMMVDWDRIRKSETLMGSVRLTGPLSGARAGWNAGKSLPGKIAHGGAGALINGKGVLWGGALLAGTAKAFNQVNQAHMGQMDGMVTTPTARTPYLDPAGATGDLVFAMNANRKG